jgi:hypothetical protein
MGSMLMPRIFYGSALNQVAYGPPSSQTIPTAVCFPAGRECRPVDVEPVAVAEVMVVEFLVRPVGRRVADQRAPVPVVLEDLLGLAQGGGEPIGQGAADGTQRAVPHPDVTDLIGDLGNSRGTAQTLSRPIGVGLCIAIGSDATCCR